MARKLLREVFCARPAQGHLTAGVRKQSANVVGREANTDTCATLLTEI